MKGDSPGKINDIRFITRNQGINSPGLEGLSPRNEHLEIREE
jgi:hypothetical protein